VLRSSTIATSASFRLFAALESFTYNLVLQCKEPEQIIENMRSSELLSQALVPLQLLQEKVESLNGTQPCTQMNLLGCFTELKGTGRARALLEAKYTSHRFTQQHHLSVNGILDTCYVSHHRLTANTLEC
jgi:hypothetical protein